MDASHLTERGSRGSPPRSRPTMSGMGRKRLSSTSPLFGTVTWILIVLCSSFAAFYIGVWAGTYYFASCPEAKGLTAPVSITPSDAEIQRKVEALANQIVKVKMVDLRKDLPTSSSSTSQEKNDSGSSLFSKSIQHFAQGLVRVGKDDLMQTFDFGVPPNPNTKALDALILYNKKEALPSNENDARAARYEDPTNPLPKLSAKAATENCDIMNVVLLNQGSTRQCFALVGSQYPSHHVQRWMRRPDKKGALDPEMPLKMTSRGWTNKGRQEFVPPKERHVKNHQEKLLTYLTEVGDIKSRLKQVLEKMNQKTIVVLTCNHGQSELLMNFACSARARGFDLKNVLVFPTDEETKELAEEIGLTAFYEEKLMASIPKEEAAAYGDRIFSAVMFAKVLCVQLVNDLGYDLLFQDVDVVWYKNPLDYFHNESLPDFDMYFQDDGSRAERYAPYSANSGFYFVRSNDRTRHLFRHFIYSADLITAWSSHQSVLIALLAEHNSLMGLRVKTFSKEMEEFPGGMKFHRQKDAMKKIMRGESNAIIFHMSFTKNKDDKVEFFQQMGEWYLKQQCMGKLAYEITNDMSESSSSNEILLADHCCSSEPLITCHYRDKPSKIPCPDSPSIGEKGKSFYSGFTAEKGKGFW